MLGFGKKKEAPLGTRRPMMAGNWKMNKTYTEAVILAQDISFGLDKDFDDYCDIVLCPPFIDIKPVHTVIETDRRHIAVGAQDVYWEEEGAYTGEISPRMLAEIGVEYCIVGHSERRELMGETNEMVNKKVRALLAKRINPIICVGESLAVREQGTTMEYVLAQLDAALAGIDDTYGRKCVIAYEPIWAIGTGRTATPEQAQEVCAAIRARLAEMYGQEIADSIRVLYGGSMNQGNVEMLIAQPDIDGGLVGGASLKAESFVQLIEACKSK